MYGMNKCIQCGKVLAGRQKKYCSRLCKNSYNNQAYQSYQAQQLRGRNRKIELIKLKGSKCELCCYRKNFAALEFHHVIPETKLFQLDLRSLSNRKWEMVLEEAKKCRLLCSNCHAELHNPDCKL
jgi:hypothetical protein